MHKLERAFVIGGLLVGGLGAVPGSDAKLNKGSVCEVGSGSYSFEQVFNTKLGKQAVNSGLKGSVYNPPFLGSVDKNGDYHIVASIFQKNENGVIAGELDSVNYPDPYAKIQVAGYYPDPQPDGTWKYREIDCTKSDAK